MNDTPGLASSQHFTITNDEPVQGAGLPTGSLQEAWNDILNRIRTTYAADLELASEYGLAWLGALLALQQGFRRLPGLVADGRDMGTVVFAQAPLKVFLTANAEERAQRRYKQLISQGFSANIDDLRADLQARDARDRNRSIAPLQPAPDAMLLDNSAMDIAASVRQVLQWWQGKQPFAAHE